MNIQAQHSLSPSSRPPRSVIGGTCIVLQRGLTTRNVSYHCRVLLAAVQTKQSLGSDSGSYFEPRSDRKQGLRGQPQTLTNMQTSDAKKRQFETTSKTECVFQIKQVMRQRMASFFRSRASPLFIKHMQLEWANKGPQSKFNLSRRRCDERREAGVVIPPGEISFVLRSAPNGARPKTEPHLHLEPNKSQASFGSGKSGTR